MCLSQPLMNALAFICLSALLWQHCCADIPDNNVINNLYDNLLQREYAGPVVFPNHQVERKAQRSPSLRLRFGRRSDPDMYLPAEKRWFGDVNQKPIRSPSLRLRFGRRSDPSMPLHSELDALMNDLASVSNNGGIADAEDATAFFGDEYPEDIMESAFERVVRKPQRLRFGRSLPRIQNNVDDELEQTREQRQQTEDFFNSLLTSEKLHNMLLSLRQFDGEPLAADDNEFQREVRKPAPLRLRFGRSTGGNAEAQKIVTAQNALDANKSVAVVAPPQQHQQAQNKN
ncbi:PREDICTED: short neuropeptide F [Rhagoletis zephyria]|uniref:short neuropeptide F n=1 Tax=Rhagoletis zephyria TaxID=28612 RepID=UPI0008117319|nr:PREDICTED: short neuropeptide F [Rhagoletis zephyria]XP_036321199.1 short neuropeptide F [Rhagoletis pomonella]